jgi:hypothetical protein
VLFLEVFFFLVGMTLQTIEQEQKGVKIVFNFFEKIFESSPTPLSSNSD